MQQWRSAQVTILEIGEHRTTGDWWTLYHRRLVNVLPQEIGERCTTGDWWTSYHRRLVIVIPQEIGERRTTGDWWMSCGGPTLKIRHCLTTPLFRNPVAKYWITGIEKQHQQVASSSKVRSLWEKQTAHNQQQLHTGTNMVHNKWWGKLNRGLQ